MCLLYLKYGLDNEWYGNNIRRGMVKEVGIFV